LVVGQLQTEKADSASPGFICTPDIGRALNDENLWPVYFLSNVVAIEVSRRARARSILPPT
jgi:hypothetical protein